MYNCNNMTIKEKTIYDRKSLVLPQSGGSSYPARRFALNRKKRKKPGLKTFGNRENLLLVGPQLYKHRRPNLSCPPFTQGRDLPRCKRRGAGRFSERICLLYFGLLSSLPGRKLESEIGLQWEEQIGARIMTTKNDRRPIVERGWNLKI
jgi:hypothetical protein